ncbi:class I SAM-dependent methyltransferase [Acetobacter fabarum]|uniref:class I SAM-dependent methyltransferase n=2 Tax=Acetobacter fabarum TaxID=483199 RepID=UPI00222FC1F4|nr:class I SAM-dependent methyltransferase [Acetobacter fabarum]
MSFYARSATIILQTGNFFHSKKVAMSIFDNRGILCHIYKKLLHKYYSNDLWIDLKINAKKETVDYILNNMGRAIISKDRYSLLKYAFQHADKEGLILEFGVEKGASINYLASLTQQTVHGFDSFEGLPTDWKGTMETKGAFDMNKAPPKVRPNVQLHIGWFDDVIPVFLKQTDNSIAYMHVDCDTYESTKILLDLTKDRIKTGTVIVFDEYFNYPGWKENEFKAFQEFVADTKIKYEYIGFSSEKGHVAVRII